MEQIKKTRLYVMTERDLEIIDGLVNMLNLAITEVFASKAAHYEPFTQCPVQAKFNKQCYQILEGDDPDK